MPDNVEFPELSVAVETEPEASVVSELSMVTSSEVLIAPAVDNS